MDERKVLEMGDEDEEEYDNVFRLVENEVSQLRVVLEGVEARERERVWLRGKTAGELDDTRLVDAIIGDSNVYKKRGKAEQMFGLVQKRPKRLVFLMDVSSSMSNFNADHRLDRMCATTVMVMEAFQGLGHKYEYAVIGHSGETAWLPLVPMGQPPGNRRERLQVIRDMIQHSAYCRSGDHTLAASIKSMHEVTAEEADDYFVFLVSDANLEGYGVSPDSLTKVLTSDARVNAFAVFIAEEGTAAKIQAGMPSGRAHVVLDTQEMPLLFKNIFANALLDSPKSLL